MNVEILVVKDEIPNYFAPGHIIAVQLSGYPWTAKQRADYYTIVNYDLSNDAIFLIKQLCKDDYFVWDFSKNKIVLWNGDDISPNMFVAPELYTQADDKEVASTFSPFWASTEPDVCKFLHSRVYGENPEPGDEHPREKFGPFRKEWLVALLPYADLGGVRRLLWAVQYGRYGSVISAARQLSADAKTAFLHDSFAPKIRHLLKDNLQVI
jgi:hypothetical protein